MLKRGALAHLIDTILSGATKHKSFQMMSLNCPSRSMMAAQCAHDISYRSLASLYIYIYTYINTQLVRTGSRSKFYCPVKLLPRKMPRRCINGYMDNLFTRGLWSCFGWFLRLQGRGTRSDPGCTLSGHPHPTELGWGLGGGRGHFIFKVQLHA